MYNYSHNIKEEKVTVISLRSRTFVVINLREILYISRKSKGDTYIKPTLFFLPNV